jgi:hypothetical protein
VIRRRRSRVADVPRWALWSYTSEWWSDRAAHDEALNELLAKDGPGAWRIFVYTEGFGRVSDALAIHFGWPDWDARRGGRLWPAGVEIYWPIVPPREPRGGERPWPPPPGGPPPELVAAVEARAAEDDEIKRKNGWGSSLAR